MTNGDCHYEKYDTNKSHSKSEGFDPLGFAGSRKEERDGEDEEDGAVGRELREGCRC